MILDHFTKLRLLFVIGILLLAANACSGPEMIPLAGDSLAAGDESEVDPAKMNEPPVVNIDTDKIYLATMRTEKGDICIELFADKAPITVNNFIFLAEGGFYDGTTFHRVIPGFMAQGGDPEGTGMGGPGYRFQDEISFDLRFNGEGYLAMANAGPNTNGSQFFITYGPTEYLNGRHTIFGKVVEGMDVLRALTARDPSENPDFEGDRLETVDIEVIAESLLPLPVVPILEEGRPLAAYEIGARENIYIGKPEMSIDLNKSYTAVIQTSRGEIVLELRPQEAPESVNNFVILTQLGYWDGFPIAYVEPELLVITGSPGVSQNSDIGYSLPAEIGLQNTAGAVGYVIRQDLLVPSGSQFYITMQDYSDLDEFYPVFGYVIEGLDVVRKLSLADQILTITIAMQ